MARDLPPTAARTVRAGRGAAVAQRPGPSTVRQALGTPDLPPAGAVPSGLADPAGSPDRGSPDRGWSPDRHGVLPMPVNRSCRAGSLGSGGVYVPDYPADLTFLEALTDSGQWREQGVTHWHAAGGEGQRRTPSPGVSVAPTATPSAFALASRPLISSMRFPWRVGWGEPGARRRGALRRLRALRRRDAARTGRPSWSARPRPDPR
jgi:hypothetical protein